MLRIDAEGSKAWTASYQLMQIIRLHFCIHYYFNLFVSLLSHLPCVCYVSSLCVTLKLYLG